MRRTLLVCGFVALSTLAAAGAATASPPHGVAVLTDLARGTAVGSATTSIKPGTASYVGTYTVESGSSAGWRAQPGASVLAVTKGTLRVVQAKGCAPREYSAPQVAVLPAGTLHVSNPGGDAAEFVGYFDNLKANSGQPLVSGSPAEAPKGCAAGGQYRAASGGLAATDIARGVYAQRAGYGGGHHAHHARSDVAARSVIPEGADVVIIRIFAMPGTSTGWYRHAPGVGTVNSGLLGIYEATENGCERTAESRAGDASSHLHYGLHMSQAEGPDPLDAIGIWWGVDTKRTPVPMFGNFMDANDLTPLPPAGCTTF